MIKEAIRRREIRRNLDEHLRRIREVVRRLDPEAEVYLFGSVAEGRGNLASDIDVLIVTELKPELVLSELWRAGIKDPFEIHIHRRKDLSAFKRRGRLVRVD